METRLLADVDGTLIRSDIERCVAGLVDDLRASLELWEVDLMRGRVPSLRTDDGYREGKRQRRRGEEDKGQGNANSEVGG